jgi:hypothetical protein
MIHTIVVTDNIDPEYIFFGFALYGLMGADETSEAPFYHSRKESARPSFGSLAPWAELARHTMRPLPETGQGCLLLLCTTAHQGVMRSDLDSLTGRTESAASSITTPLCNFQVPEEESYYPKKTSK